MVSANAFTLSKHLGGDIQCDLSTSMRIS